MKSLKSLLAKFLDETFWKFLLVGVINTLIGTSVMFVFYNVFHLSYWISSASNYIIGSIVSYFLNKYFTFQYRERSWRSVLRFVLNISVCYLIAYGAAKPLVCWIFSGFGAKVQDNLAMLGGMCFFVLLNYCGQRFFVFRRVRRERVTGAETAGTPDTQEAPETPEAREPAEEKPAAGRAAEEKPPEGFEAGTGVSGKEPAVASENPTEKETTEKPADDAAGRKSR